MTAHEPTGRVRWVPLEVCAGLIEEAVREAMEDGGFLRGTVDAAVRTARDKAERLAADLYADDGQGDVDGPLRHGGPITAACPIECLDLPARSRNALVRLGKPPETVGEVLALARAGDLPYVRNLGRKSVREIKNALRRAGFDPSRALHRHHADGSPAK